MLVHPQQHAPTCITTDASNRAVGAVLEQFINGQWKPIPFFSKELSPAELKYSAFGRELLAAYLAVRHFQYFVEGRVFQINTDHKPLTFALHSSAERHSPRQAGIWLLFLSSQQTSAISRVKLIVSLMHFHVTYLIWNNPQSTSTPLLLPKTRMRSSLSSPPPPLHCSLHKYLFRIPGGLYFMISPKVVPVLWCPQQCVEPSLTNCTLTLSHPGIKASRRLISEGYVWLNMKRDIACWTRTCHECQQLKVQRHVKAPLKAFPRPDCRFDSIHVDIFGPCTCLLALTDTPTGPRQF